MCPKVTGKGQVDLGARFFKMLSRKVVSKIKEQEQVSHIFIFVEVLKWCNLVDGFLPL